MTETITVSSSELSAMRAELRELRGTVATLVSLFQNGSLTPASSKLCSVDEEHRSLTDAEREYRIDRQELQALLGVSERTAYRRIKVYGFRMLRENGDAKFILGEVADLISFHGLGWHRSALDRILSRRTIKSRTRFV